MAVKRVGVLTSGGDAPGMNAAIRAVVRAGIHYGNEMFGIRRGFLGLLNNDVVELNARSVSKTLQGGGTFLQTARSEEFRTPEGVKKGADMLHSMGIENLVVIGGDGSFKGAMDLSKHGIGVIGIPATIDNDIGCTEYSIGFDTALNTAIEAVDKLRDTGYSHERCNIIEVMGRRAGYIAINVGIATGAESVIIPEQPFDIDEDVVKHILENKARNKTHFAIIVAEGIGLTPDMVRYVTEKTGVETRVSVLGHLQRGGSPSAQDRVMASLFGARAMKLVNQDKINRVVAIWGGQPADFDIRGALAMVKSVETELLELSKIMSL